MGMRAAEPGNGGTAGNGIPTGRWREDSNFGGRNEKTDLLHTGELQPRSPPFPRSPGCTKAIGLLERAAELGVRLSTVDGWLDWQADAAPPSTFIEELRAHKTKLVALLRGELCRCCGARIDWRQPSAVAFADGRAACLGCYERVETERQATRRERQQPMEQAA
jgi:hypothetical protein